ncbi:MAG: hypothetical protein M3N48_00655 [Verrucomicrobiota bacterium]|nr:hypothetical protein [Verrucomicrobiota bacterium]
MATNKKPLKAVKTKEGKKPKAAKKPKASKRLEAAMAPILALAGSASDVVHRCVIHQVGHDAQDDSPISSIAGLSADNLGGCINDNVPLIGRQRFRSGNIQSSDTLLDVTNATTTRRGMQP